MTEPVWNVTAEQAALGAILLRPECISDLPNWDSDIFYSQVHVDIFREMKRRIKLDQLVSPVSMNLWANSYEGLQEHGGGKYLVLIAGGSGGPSNIGHYGAILDELHAKRKIATALEAAMMAIHQDEDTAAVISSRLEMALVDVSPGAAAGPVSMMKAVTNAVTDINDVHMGNEVDGVKTGIAALDEKLGKFQPGQLILLGGRPSMGKSAVALSMALNVARSGKGVAIATLEMTPESMAIRAISEASSRTSAPTAYSEMLRSTTEPQMRAIVESSREVADLPIQFLPANYRDVGALYAGAKKCKALFGGNMGLLVIDYLQLLNGEGRSRLEQITQISIALKALAMQLGIPILALSQLSRSLESRDDKRPVMSDLRESGQLEQDADAILFCFRHEYYLEREKPDMSNMDNYAAWEAAMERSRGSLDIIVAKQRQGQIGTVPVRFNPALNRVWDVSE